MRKKEVKAVYDHVQGNNPVASFGRNKVHLVRGPGLHTKKFETMKATLKKFLKYEDEIRSDTH